MSDHEPERTRALIPFSGRTTTVLASIALALIVGVVLLRGFTATALAYSFFVVIGVWLSAFDLRWKILPNRVLVPAIGIGLVLLLTATVVDDAPADDVVGRGLRVVLGGLALFVAFLVLALISPRGIGMGDVKLAGFVGMFLAFDGWRALVLGAAAGFVCVAIVGVVLLIARRIGPHATIPFGPMMFVGAAFVLAI